MSNITNLFKRIDRLATKLQLAGSLICSAAAFYLGERLVGGLWLMNAITSLNVMMLEAQLDELTK